MYINNSMHIHTYFSMHTKYLRILHIIIIYVHTPLRSLMFEWK